MSEEHREWIKTLFRWYGTREVFLAAAQEFEQVCCTEYGDSPQAHCRIFQPAIRDCVVAIERADEAYNQAAVEYMQSIAPFITDEAEIPQDA